LIDEERARRACGDGLGEVLIIVVMAAGDVRAREHHFGAHCFAVQNFLARHLVGDDEYDAVPLATTDQRETKARIPRRRLDDGAAGL
jgi:hypothetical protein